MVQRECICTFEGKFRLAPHALRCRGWSKSRPDPNPWADPAFVHKKYPADADYLLGNFSGGTKQTPYQCQQEENFLSAT